MNLAKFSNDNNRVVLSILLVIVVIGALSYVGLSRDSMPPYTVRVASIVTPFPGASPERVEELVTDKIEKVVQELPELKEVKSTSRTGLSIVQAELRMETKPEDLQSVWDRLRRKLDVIEGLPANSVPNLQDDGIGEVFGIVVGLVSDGYNYAEIKEYADDLRNDLIKLDDAAKVEINGEQQEIVYINFDDNTLRNYGLTATSLKNILSSQNILSSGGQINVDDARIILEPTGNYNSLEDIKNTLIPVSNEGQLLRLGDITNVEKGYIDPPTQIVRVDGKPAISLHISLKENANVINLGKEVDRVLAEYEEILPVGLDAYRLSSIDTYIDLKISSFVSNLIQAIVIVLLVMLIFLGMRTGLVIASLIPIVTITTLMVMGLIDMGLNQITLAALIMALGMMVDNGIVVAESIMVRMEKGMDARKAAVESAAELTVPLLISTLTTSAAFLAFYMAESTMGDIMGPLFVVISIALVSSWIISLSVITLFCVYFLKVKPKSKDTQPGFLDRIIESLKMKYKDLMLFALSRKRTVLIVIVLLFVGSLYGFTKLGFLFFPDSDRNMVTVDINLSEGTKIEKTEATVLGIEKFLQDNLLVNENRPEGVVNWTAFMGEGPSSYDLGYSPDEPNSNYGHILINSSNFEVNNDLIRQIDSFAFNSFPDADVKVAKLGNAGGGAPVEIKVSGDDPDQLSAIASTIKSKLFGISGTKNIKDDWGPKGKKFLIDIDQSRARNAGITNQDIAVSLQAVLDGFKTGDFREGDKNIPLIMKAENSSDIKLEDLESLTVYSQNTGQSVPFLQVASVVPQWQYSKIKRLDLDRTIIVTSELSETGNASVIMSELLPWLDEQTLEWPKGYSYSVGGESEQTAENMGAVVKYLPLSVFIIVMLLIVQFNSFRKMTMIVCTIPLGVIGMVIGLLAFDVPFGFMAFLGVISLAGIVINNAIVLVDRIEIEQKEYKRSDTDAVVAACLQRFRPIILATFTTVLGLVPLYLGGGEMWEPMAVTIMIGLLFGTVITLLFIPAFFSVLYKVNFENYKFDSKLLED